jgi:hypothetical protein
LSKAVLQSQRTKVREIITFAVAWSLAEVPVGRVGAVEAAERVLVGTATGQHQFTKRVSCGHAGALGA